MHSLFENLILPPGCLLLCACAGLLLRRRRLAGAGILGLLVLSLPVVSTNLLALLGAGLDTRVDPAAPPQAIVILSGDQQRIVAADGTTWHVGMLTLQREAAGARLARRTHLPVLVSGGVIRPGAPSLAAMMTGSMDDDFATPVRWSEDRSGDTWQNAVDSAAILRAQGIDRIYLVTNAWHMRRALLAFRHAGLRAVPAPVQFDAGAEWSVGSFTPNARALQESYWASHELLGWAWYALKS
jgi:uncharacterized SAM-binding protein YcdF (DUF218 family)